MRLRPTPRRLAHLATYTIENKSIAEKGIFKHAIGDYGSVAIGDEASCRIQSPVDEIPARLFALGDLVNRQDTVAIGVVGVTNDDCSHYLNPTVRNRPGTVILLQTRQTAAFGHK